MALTVGTRIGNYEIVAPLGAGGMGEVYRARDTRLGRVVAIKALPQAFARDTERLARFEREARLLASLNHPNIAGIHGIEDSGGSPYLVLEYVSGETLAERLARGPLSVAETLEIGIQIASAVEAAHERGVVHRDLKPGNIMLTPSLAAKVLDFGLAKGGDPVGGPSAGLSATPTVAMTATAEGIILGTAPYMSPEQARGQAVDRRGDVWAFGCVLYECLTGRQAFQGGTVSDVIARILERAPEWGAIPASTPTRLRDLIRRCLTKEVANRPRDIGDLRGELTAIAADLSSPGAPAAGTSTRAGSGPPSLAVLYFENLSSDAESDYFCAGITEDILTDLSKIKGMRVASRNAVARYRGAPADIAKVAAELGVSAVLEGSVRRAGDRVRISAQLINAVDGFHLWAERYDRTLQDVFAVQEEIASSIASALRVALTPVESENLVQDRPRDVRAYDLYLKARQYYGRYTPEGIGYALELFRQATQVDPEYARAFAGMADCYGQMLQWGSGEHRDELTRLGLEAARRAIQLSPRLAEAHKAEGLVLRFSGNRQGSQSALVRALELDSRYLPALINLAVDAFSRADLAANERLIRRALEVDPQDPFATTWLGFLSLLTDRPDEVMAAAQRLQGLSSDAFYITAVHGLQAMCHLRRGDLAAAEREVREGRAKGAEPSNMLGFEAVIAARAGRAEEAKRTLTGLEGVSTLGSGTLVAVAGAAVRVGEVDRAVGFMLRQITKDLAPTFVRLDPELHPLLDREPFAPRRWDVTLVWALEAPALDPARQALFREIRLESGLPRGSDVLSGAV